jgi:hypothetical protein
MRIAAVHEGTASRDLHGQLPPSKQVAQEPAPVARVHTEADAAARTSLIVRRFTVAALVPEPTMKARLALRSAARPAFRPKPFSATVRGSLRATIRASRAGRVSNGTAKPAEVRATGG